MRVQAQFVTTHRRCDGQGCDTCHNGVTYSHAYTYETDNGAAVGDYVMAPGSEMAPGGTARIVALGSNYDGACRYARLLPGGGA